MKPRILLFALLALSMLLPAGRVIAAEAEAAPVAPSDLMLVIRAKNDAATREAAKRIEAAAEAGNSFAMYDIGSLHRQSSRKGAAVFAYDPGKSLKWLTRAFSAGRLTAAYKIALIYAEIGDDMEAMGWAQLYSHFIRDDETASGPQQARLWLLNDLYARVGRDREDEIERKLKHLLEMHGPAFEVNREREEPKHPDWVTSPDACRVTVPPRGHAAPVRSPGSGLVEYLVEIEPSGRPGPVVALDSTPQAKHARDLRTLVQRLNCERSDTPDSRYAFHVFQLQTGPRLKLQNSAPTNSR